MNTTKIILIILIYSSLNHLNAQMIPNTNVDAPNKLCYDYDKAGNRVGQNPSWILPEYSPELTCTPNDPESTITMFGTVFLYPPITGENNNPSSWPIGVWTDNGSVTNNPPGNRSIAQQGNTAVSITIHIIPNPNIGQFRVAQRGFDIDNSRIFIYNSSGQLIFDREYVNGDVNISELPVGVYILKLVDFFNERSVKFEKRM